MGIHKSLRIIFSNQADNTYQWVKKPNQAAPFNGRSALQFMLSGRITELSDVRRYLDWAHSPTCDATNYAFDSEHMDGNVVNTILDFGC